MSVVRRWRGLLIEGGPLLGLMGVSIAVTASIVTAVPYSGLDGEPYSPFNHTVSELGERGISELAAVFNLGLVAGGVLIALYMLGRSYYATLQDRSGWVFGTLGMAAAVAMVLVGLFPVDDIEPHMVAAAMAFLLILATAAWFAVWCLRGSAPYPRWLGWFAAWIAAAVVALLLLPGILQPEYHFEMDFDVATPRPDVWLNATLEWLVIGSAWTWIATLAWHDRGQNLT